MSRPNIHYSSSRKHTHILCNRVLLINSVFHNNKNLTVSLLKHIIIFDNRTQIIITLRKQNKDIRGQSGVKLVKVVIMFPFTDTFKI